MTPEEIIRAAAPGNPSSALDARIRNVQQLHQELPPPRRSEKQKEIPSRLSISFALTVALAVVLAVGRYNRAVENQRTPTVEVYSEVIDHIVIHSVAGHPSPSKPRSLQDYDMKWTVRPSERTNL